MPVAAIESLVELLTQSQASTISETLTLLETSTAHLKSHIPNPISLSAGTDLFQRYLINALQRPGAMAAGNTAAGDFKSIRQHLISNGRLFVSRAKASREKIAGFGRHFVRDGNTVLTNGGSRVVGALLRHAAEDSKGSSVRFRVIYVLDGGGDATHNKKKDSDSDAAAVEGVSIVRSLREQGVPVAVISEAAVGYAMGKVDMVIVGAEGVVENGGIISRLGTYQIGLLARAARKPFYVVAESHKFVRLYPLSQYDLPIEQKVIDFRTVDDDEKEEEERGKKGLASRGYGDDSGSKKGYFDQSVQQHRHDQSSNARGNEKTMMAPTAVDFTPPDLISALITESGVLTPSAVSEELIRIWF